MKMYPNYLIEMSRSTLQAAQQAGVLNMQLTQALLEACMRMMRVAVENQLGMMGIASERALSNAAAPAPGTPVLVEDRSGEAA
jgi:hypothetical protein